MVRLGTPDIQPITPPQEADGVDFGVTALAVLSLSASLALRRIRRCSNGCGSRHATPAVGETIARFKAAQDAAEALALSQKKARRSLRIARQTAAHFLRTPGVRRAEVRLGVDVYHDHGTRTRIDTTSLRGETF